jgi:hypothetical protein
MTRFFAFLAPLALLSPAWAGGWHTSGPDSAAARLGEAPAASSLRQTPAPFSNLQRSILPQPQNQVRIEQRVIIRIAPSPPAAREQMLARLPRRKMETRFEEVEAERCVPIRAIAGVAPVEQNRLLLFMRDRRVLSAALERACDAQAFYSGFYVERNDDGMLCIGRDMLQSRAGSSCGVAQFNRLVAIRD